MSVCIYVYMYIYIYIHTHAHTDVYEDDYNVILWGYGSKFRAP